MSFKEAVAADNSVFLSLSEFAENRTVIYDGVTYSDIPIVLSGLKEQDRRQLQVSDHGQGLYLVSSIMHCKSADLDGNTPEKGKQIKINDVPGSTYYLSFYVATSVCEMGMLRVELEAIDE